MSAILFQNELATFLLNESSYYLINYENLLLLNKCQVLIWLVTASDVSKLLSVIYHCYLSMNLL